MLNLTKKLYVMKKTKKQLLITACGNGAREVYLSNHPHGFASVTKVHKNSKKYNRQKEKNFNHDN